MEPSKRVCLDGWCVPIVEPIDYRCDNSQFWVSVSWLPSPNPALISSSETQVHLGLRSKKSAHLNQLSVRKPLGDLFHRNVKTWGSTSWFTHGRAERWSLREALAFNCPASFSVHAGCAARFSVHLKNKKLDPPPSHHMSALIVKRSPDPLYSDHGRCACIAIKRKKK